MKQVGLIGAGKLVGIIARELRAGSVPGCAPAGILGRSAERTRALAEQVGCPACESVEALLALKPDFVAEAATPDAVRSYALPVLRAGVPFLCLSVGALESDALRREIEAVCAETGARLYLCSGVIGGFDACAALSLMGGTGSVIKYKPPQGSGKCPPAFSSFPDAFSGTAREGYRISPAHLNIAVSGGLALGGLDENRFEIRPVSDAEPSGFGMEAESDGYRLRLRVDCKPGSDRSGSVLAAYSVLSQLRRLTAAITF